MGMMIESRGACLLGKERVPPCNSLSALVALALAMFSWRGQEPLFSTLHLLSIQHLWRCWHWRFSLRWHSHKWLNQSSTTVGLVQCTKIWHGINSTRCSVVKGVLAFSAP